MNDPLPSPPPLASRSERWAVLRVQDQLYAIDGRSSKGIVQITSWTRLPLAPTYLLGAINLRGVVVPLLDLALVLRKAASPRRPTAQQPLLGFVVEAAQMRVALAVDEVVAFAPIDPAAKTEQSAQSAVGEPYGSATWVFRDQTVVLLDSVRLLYGLKLPTATNNPFPAAAGTSLRS